MCGCGRKGHKGDNGEQKVSESNESLEKKRLDAEIKRCRSDNCCADGYYCKFGFCKPQSV